MQPRKFRINQSRDRHAVLRKSLRTKRGNLAKPRGDDKTKETSGKSSAFFHTIKKCESIDKSNNRVYNTKKVFFFL